MQAENPNLWQYAPANSPLPLPEGPVIVTKTAIHYLTKSDEEEVSGELLNLQDIQQYCSNYTSEGKTIDSILSLEKAELLQDRKPFLLLGELANPFQLNRLNIGPMPIFTIRLENLCRTYADALDSRMINPGIHHVTLARSEGWWEKTHMAMATIGQMKSMITWLNNGRRAGDWKPVKPAEGIIRFENDFHLQSPSMDMLHWDGSTESVKQETPQPTGPSIELKQIMAPIHTKWGCYDSRGKLIRCSLVGQRDFHTNYFRRGSSKKWQDILKIE
ncbi:MAG: hypothetical protein HN433_04025, partial [Euryarchaeota archaeon]|jgi:hypothetical protein|nr:hypothetical protein [Euryarchaeota archaeon]